MIEEQESTDSEGADVETAARPAAEEARPPADTASRTVSELKEHGDKLGKDIERTRQDWQTKQDSAGIPGAVPEDGDPAGLAKEAPGGSDEDQGEADEDSTR